MNQYFIEYKVSTLAYLWDEPFCFRGIEFRQWGIDWQHGPIGDAWIASKTVEANDVESAMSGFLSELIDIVDRIAFVSQCFASTESESFLIRRTNENPENVFFHRFKREVSGVPLEFGEAQRTAMEALEQYEEPGAAFRCLREATNAPTFFGRFAMLCAALEAMSGEIQEKNRKRTNTEYMKNVVLKDESLYQRIFGYGEGIRHQMLHGRPIDFSEKYGIETDYIKIIYDAILAYFREEHGVKIEEDVVLPQRTPTGCTGRVIT